VPRFHEDVFAAIFVEGEVHRNDDSWDRNRRLSRCFKCSAPDSYLTR
jgi:hypothetical protein